jgi:hypothetical protein
VLENHPRGSSYFRQPLKRPLIAPCDCISCREGILSSIIMPDETYKKLHETFIMPLPIPKPSHIEGKHDLQYMSLEEAVKQPFTDKRQPSLINRRQNNNVATGEVFMDGRESRSTESNNQNKITQGKYVRGLVSCKDCMKPRCLYSFTSPNRMKPIHVDGAIVPTGDAIRTCREYVLQQFESV